MKGVPKMELGQYKLESVPTLKIVMDYWHMWDNLSISKLWRKRQRCQNVQRVCTNVNNTVFTFLQYTVLAIDFQVAPELNKLMP